MGDLEERLRRLERRLVWQPSVEESLDASNRERTRSLHALAGRLEKYGFDGEHLFTEETFRMLSQDTPEKRGRDREIVEAWHRTKGIDRTQEVEGAKERLLAKLEGRGGK